MLNEFFELVEDPARPDARAGHLFEFEIIEAASHYVRLRLADPVSLAGLQLVGPVN